MTIPDLDRAAWCWALLFYADETRRGALWTRQVPRLERLVRWPLVSWRVYRETGRWNAAWIAWRAARLQVTL